MEQNISSYKFTAKKLSYRSSLCYTISESHHRLICRTKIDGKVKLEQPKPKLSCTVHEAETSHQFAVLIFETLGQHNYFTWYCPTVSVEDSNPTFRSGLANNDH